MKQIDRRRTWLWILAACFLSQAAGQQHPDVSHPPTAGGFGDRLGTVHFPVSCSDAASSHMTRGLALLHHMTYEGARAEFEAAAATDPACAMAYWGQAMTFIHPLWSDPPGEAGVRRGRELIERAKALAEKSGWEEAYIAAADAYYAAGRTHDEKPNLYAFEEGWRNAHTKFPHDAEAACFYALARIATADPADKTYSQQREAAAIAKQVLSRLPDHPGAHHYTIHALDYAPLAEEALPVARSYGKIAPAVPHALHMPAHIFTRLGLWPESIEMNRRSADAAMHHAAGGEISLHGPHALDYLVYAHLQRAEDGIARAILDTLQTMKGPFQPHAAIAYTFAAVPARIALERQQWEDAARLPPRTPADYAWDSFPAMEAITHFARALGAARSGDPTTARDALERLEQLRAAARKTSAYWAEQIDIQRETALAWLAHGEGRTEEALERMRHAADREAATEKHPVTPGEVLPARELLGDMLLELGHYDEARREYEAALQRYPNRFNSLYGAGRAAHLQGDSEAASSFYRKLVAIAAPESALPRLMEAKSFLATK